ncbi:alpha-amylase/4-alpha-glucanotransferase domain-containing protein [Candidatus Omnitrophota bacterium]
MNKAKFAMAFHCNQPVFNFESEYETAYSKAYLPLMATLEDFPGIKASFHFSGSMIEWFEEKHPEYIDMMKRLLSRGQIELIGGGYFEPVMSLIPECDRMEQLRLNSGVISRVFDVEPEGAWCSERVWEPELADTFTSAGIKYTVLDDYHFYRAGLDEKKMFSPFSVEKDEESLAIFPSLTRLRYSMPFRVPEVTMDYFKRMYDERHEEETSFFFADDGEKFGAWPHTYKHVHKKGWLRNFFSLLDANSDWLRTATYSEILSEASPEKIEDIPESSYAEMMEWSGGSFKNFLAKYPEAGRMHERMIFTSDIVKEAVSKEAEEGKDASLDEAKKELFKAQAGCAYWHGTFGGLYLPHLRAGVYKHLIKAKKLVEALFKEKPLPVRSLERDSGDLLAENVISNEHLDVFVSAANGGIIRELDCKATNTNLMNTISRIPEGYHDKLQKGYIWRMHKARKAILDGYFADIHDVLGVGERGLKKVLAYDDYQRGAFLTHVFEDKYEWKDLERKRRSFDTFLKGKYTSRLEEGENFMTRTFSRRDMVFPSTKKGTELEVVKEITVGTGPELRLHHRVTRHSGSHSALKYAVEFNFLIWDSSLMQKPKLFKTDGLLLKDRFSGRSIGLSWEKDLKVFTYPVYAVNETEEGLKKTFQGVSVLITDNILSGDNDMDITIKVKCDK